MPTCGVQTMASFLKSPSGGFRGTYRYSADGQLDIDWTADGNGVPRPSPLTEHWNLELMPGGKVARISSDGYHGSIGPVTVPAGFSNYSATFGIGFGSNAPISAGNKVSIVDLRSSYGQTSFLGTFVTANSGTVARQGSGLGIGYGNWLKCDGSDCVGVRQKNSSCACKDSPNKDRIRYLADIAPARNNVYTYWCECLANGANCYRANNHVQSLLQIIDDDRLLQGWVGVETSTHVNTRTLQPDQQYSQGYWAILDMVTPDLR